MSQTRIYTLALIASVAMVGEAAIKKDGLWTNVNHSSKEVSFVNGVPSSNTRRVDTSHALEENKMSGWENFANVNRVK
jgi:hypothetical protein